MPNVPMFASGLTYPAIKTDEQSNQAMSSTNLSIISVRSFSGVSGGRRIRSYPKASPLLRANHAVSLR